MKTQKKNLKISLKVFEVSIRRPVIIPTLGMLGSDYIDKISHDTSQMAAHWTTQAMSSSIAITIAFDLHHRGMIGIVIEHITSYVWSPILKYQASVNL